MTHSCLGSIQSYYPRFSEKEKKIADYILENPDEIIHLTINEIAEDLNVAEATVFRFCKRIGFKGYQAMKIALASEVINTVHQIHEEITMQDSERTVAEKVFKSNIRTLENTLQMLDSQSLEKAVKLILHANKVEFYGTGGSALIAMDAYHKFLRTGINTFAFPDSHFQLMSASLLTKGDTAVIISHSGSNRDTLNILAVARENGANTIAITSFPKSPIAQNADVALFTSSAEIQYRSEALASRIAQLSLIDALYVNTMILNQDKANPSLEKVRRAIARTKM